MDMNGQPLISSDRKPPMATPIRAPTWVSSRRIFEQKLADLQNCSNISQLKQLHAQIIRADLHQDLYVAPRLILAFSLCRHLTLAVKVFNEIKYPNAHLYNALIRAHAHNSEPSKVFLTFFHMQSQGISADNFTYPFLLRVCSGIRMVEMIHSHIEKLGFWADIFVPNSLIDSYCKCCLVGVSSARELFMAMVERDVVSWNSMICGYVKSDELKEARRLFDEMPERDVVSWNTILDGYVKSGEMNVAFELFERMSNRNVVSWSTIVSGYCKAGDMTMARTLFDKMPVNKAHLVPWTVIISGYAKKGFPKEAMSLYDEMWKNGFKPDDAAIISIISACAESGLLVLGEKVHASIEGITFAPSIWVSNALIDMYAKCGSVKRALDIFEGMGRRDLVSWNAIIHGLGIHGHGERALRLFSRMREECFQPDKVTLIGVLCACTHAGFVDEGICYFYTMEDDYGIIPQIEHYGCLIDLLGRGGRLEQASHLVHSMPMEPNAIIWGALLGACRMHYDVGLAKEVIDRLVNLEPSDAGIFSVLSNIYAATGDWPSVANMRMQMKNAGIQKPSGASSIEIDGEVHEFTVLDNSHPESERVYRMIHILRPQLKQAGYVPAVVS
ncbi:hypothetical protein Nepgr_021122 [Nepenthes gracilis]|uniref:Pentatricopeptide repeat-containing protein n=1 Tax=Nepenthes gracilis TaxID=150966 RepID=A0AAD3T0B2_NEPGR|nr:hypothetical protein Nepgr_021122 [Nepenthes gracilis]